MKWIYEHIPIMGIFNHVSIWAFQHDVPVYSPKDIKRKLCQIALLFKLYFKCRLSILLPNSSMFQSIQAPSYLWSKSVTKQKLLVCLSSSYQSCTVYISAQCTLYTTVHHSVHCTLQYSTVYAVHYSTAQFTLYTTVQHSVNCTLQHSTVYTVH